MAVLLAPYQRHQCSAREQSLDLCFIQAVGKAGLHQWKQHSFAHPTYRGLVDSTKYHVYMYHSKS